MSTAAQAGASSISDLRRSRVTRERRLADLVGLGPITLLYGVFILVPIVGLAVLSFFRWNGLGTPHWAGLANWREFVNDPTAHQALVVTVKVVIFSWLIQTPIALALGLFVAGRQRWRTVYAALYVLPLLLSTAGVALMWSALLDPSLGGLAYLAHALHFSALDQNWLGSLNLALPTLIVINAWQWIPFHTLLYQMGRRNIPEVLYEAAAVDGAGGWQTFWHITLPQLRYTIVTSSILIVVGSLTYFDIFYILTNGGPSDRTEVLSLWMYSQAFQSDNFGYAAALGTTIGVIAILSAALIIRLTGFGALRSQQAGIA
jgi:raffinose/stachyose/melibiose transport system permease protein